MIPPDLASRLRMLTEASFFNTDQGGPPVQQVARVQQAAAQFPDLIPGSAFTALIQRPLPDGTFQALVAGQEMTLALDASAQAGDSLELVVSQRTAETIVARLATDANASGSTATQAQLSTAGQLINALLTGQPETPPSKLQGGLALLPLPPTEQADTTTLAQSIKQALQQSGLFYESHLAEWMSGKTTVADLRAEPQGQLSSGQPASSTPSSQSTATSTAQALAQSILTSPQPLPSSPNPAAAQTAVPASPVTQADAPEFAQSAAQAILPGSVHAHLRSTVAADSTDQGTSQPDRQSAQTTVTGGTREPIAQHLYPVVHQQLDSLATQTLVLQGQAWPGQFFQLEIEDPRPEERDHGSAADDEAPAAWKTTLRLSMPNIGGVEARMILTDAGLAVHVTAEDPQAAATMTASTSELQDALEAAGMPLTGLLVDAHGTDT